ncbi:MAG TPA: TolC family protein [Verrucomicrobiae bacterium]
MIIGWGGIFSTTAQPSNDLASVDLRLSDYLQQVLHYNQSLQAQMIDAEAQTYKLKSEKGIFEPDFEASYTHQWDKRQNNTQQQAEQDASPLFIDRNNIYDGGVEALIPTGAKIRLGVTVSDLYNNVNPVASLGATPANQFNREFQSFAGVSVTQPLLKNGWFGPVMVNIRLAALDSQIAFEEYRRQVMLTMYQAEGAYWNLYFAQEQIHFFDDSVTAAQDVLNDSQEKLKTGQGAQLDVMEAQSALALRDTKRNDAVQSYYEALGHLQVLAGVSPNPNQPGSGSPMFRAVDDPHTSNSPPTYAETYEEGFTQNPDYLIQQEKMNQERLRLGVAKNQVLPELDAKADYGYNGLGLTPGQSWDQLGSEEYPSWDAGIQLTIPLGGNIKGRADLKGARLHLQEAYINLKGVETEMANSLSASIQKARAWQQSIQSYETVVNYDQQVFQTQLARLKAGTVDAQSVLNAEADWLDARQDMAGAFSEYHKTLLDIELADGALLKDNNLEVTRDELRQQTEEMLEHNQGYAVKNVPPPPDELFSPVPPPTTNAPD